MLQDFDKLRDMLKQTYTDEEVESIIAEAEKELNSQEGQRVLYVPMAFEANVEGMSDEDIESMKQFVIDEFKSMVTRFEEFHTRLLGADKPSTPEFIED